MRYFIFYPPTKSLKQIDIVDDTYVQEIIDMVTHEFGIRVNLDSQFGTSIVLNYNGSDLKPEWLIADLNIPSGAIIRCFSREKKTADLYVHCEFNNEILDFFDNSIINDTTIAEIRKKISDRIGIPLSTFCLETYNSRQPLYDQMKLYQYSLKPHEHLYLKVLYGYEKFLDSCMKGIPKYHSRDELIKHYELQVALHIAAFYGFMGLAHSALQLGAQSEFPVGVHPSRQWSSETTVQEMPEMLKCPIHIAIERGHMKIVDLFVRKSLLCTQVVHPISGLLPYRMALQLLISLKTKAEKKRYSEIYLYLYDKQFNLKIPLNSGNSNVVNVLKPITKVKSFHRWPSHIVFFSLPRYCKIIRWCERAKERVWKKHGTYINSSTEIKRAYQSKGVLGYKVWIDGFNNTFDASNERTSYRNSISKLQIDETNRYIGYTNEERDKILKMEAYMKQLSVEERQRAKNPTTVNLERSRHIPLYVQRTIIGTQLQTTDPRPRHSSAIHDDTILSSKLLSEEDLSSSIEALQQSASDTIDIENFSNITNPTSFIEQNEKQCQSKRTEESVSKMSSSIIVPPEMVSSISAINGKKKHEQRKKYYLPLISTSISNTSTLQSTYGQKSNMVLTTNASSDRPREMSSVDAYLLSSVRIAADEQQRKIAARRERMAKIEQSLENDIEKTTTNEESSSIQTNLNTINEITPKIPLPEHQRKSFGPIRSRHDLKIQQETIKSYEHSVSEPTRVTAMNCLQEAVLLNGKSWIQQVEISKEMVKTRTKRHIRSIVGKQSQHYSIADVIH